MIPRVAGDAWVAARRVRRRRESGPCPVFFALKAGVAPATANGQNLPASLFPAGGLRYRLVQLYSALIHVFSNRGGTMLRPIIGIALAGMFGIGGTAGAAVELDFAKPDIEYQAIRIMEAPQGTMRQKFYYELERNRTEMDIEGQQIATITREDLGVIWVLLGSNNMYMETSMADIENYAEKTEGSPDAMEVVEYSKLGEETIDGYQTTKYKVITRDPDGDQMTGFFWLTADQIAVRMEMDFEMQGEQTHIVVRLEDIEIGPLADSLFEIPSGATRIEVGGMPGFGSGSFSDQMKQSAEHGAKQGATEAVQQESKERVKEGVKKGLKKLFGG